MPTEHDIFIAPSGTSVDAINAALVSHMAVRCVGTQYWDKTVVIPEQRVLKCEAPTYVLKNHSNGPLITQNGYSAIEGRFLMEGNGHTGDAVFWPADTGHQEIRGAQIMRFAGYCINATAAWAGFECVVTDVKAQRTNLALPAIGLPEDEGGTRGIRRFQNCKGLGGFLLDIAGSNVTIMDNCSTYGFRMTNRARYAHITGNRLAMPSGVPLVVDGENNTLQDNSIGAVVNFGGTALGNQYLNNTEWYNITLMPGASYNALLLGPLASAIIDNSGNNLNKIATWALI
jgi:hypothetical protein